MSTRALSKTSSVPSVFDDFFKPWNEWFDDRRFFNQVATVPSVNITENKDNYQVALAAPGLKKEDFKIDVEGNMLTISSEKEENKEEKNEKYTRKEYSYSSFLFSTLRVYLFCRHSFSGVQDAIQYVDRLRHS